jgi:murein DD-endopeptidase MepM/ murein hydrolase activator NlpD
VVDPTAREDGGAEPDLELDPAFEQERAQLAKREPLPRGQAVRDRLLAKASEAARGPTPTPPPAAAGAPEPEAAHSEAKDEPEPELEQPQQTAQTEPPQRVPSSLDVELELIAGRPQEEPSAPRAPRLSPNLLALFGTLLGLATVGSLVALGIHLDRRVPGPITSGAAEPSPGAPASAALPAAAATPPVRPRQRKKIPGPWRIRDQAAQPGSRIVEGQIGVQPFLKALQSSGVSSKESYRVLKVLGGLKNLDNCAKSDRFVALLERASARLTAFEYVVGPEEIYQAKQDGSGILVAKKLDLHVERAQVRGAFAVDKGGVDKIAIQAGFDPGLGKVLAKAVDGHLSLDELERGDRVRVVAQEVAVLGEFARYAGIEAIEIQFGDADRKPLRIYWFQGPRSRGYFDAGGRSPYEGGWRKPVKDAPVTSKFNPKRMHPVLKKTMPHNGTDFGAPTGAPVLACSYGTVTHIGYSGPSGNLVKLEHPGGITTGYAHLSRFAEGLRVGDKVKRLQLVGYVGATGRSTGPHLHFSAEPRRHARAAERRARSVRADSRAVRRAARRDPVACAARARRPDTRTRSGGRRRSGARRRADGRGTRSAARGQTRRGQRSCPPGQAHGSAAERADALIGVPHRQRATEASVAERRRRSRGVKRRGPEASCRRAGFALFVAGAFAAPCLRRAQGNHEAAAMRQSWFHPGTAAVSLRDVLYQREPDAAAADLLVERAPAAHEAFENTLAIFGRDTDPLVRHPHLDPG